MDTRKENVFDFGINNVLITMKQNDTYQNWKIKKTLPLLIIHVNVWIFECRKIGDYLISISGI